MTEHPSPTIGTVAQEAARLIDDMAAMARAGSSGGDMPNRYAGEPDSAPTSPGAPPSAAPAEDHETMHDADESAEEVCGACGGERDGTPASCRLCPLCQGIALLRSVRPETVDMLADLALSLAATLRDVAVRSRAADPSSGRSGPGSSPDADRDHVQDIPVDDESEG